MISFPVLHTPGSIAPLHHSPGLIDKTWYSFLAFFQAFIFTQTAILECDNYYDFCPSVYQ